MDLSNLSTNLPPTQPITDESIQELSNEITTNFKDAAKSVLALYRLSQSKNTLLINKGYLDCVNDILKVISRGDDVEDWVLNKKNELTRLNNGDVEEEDVENEIKKGVFKMDSPAPYKFPASMIPLSMDRSNIQHYKSRSKKKFENSISEDEEDDEEEEIIYEDNKRKIIPMTNVVDKKLKSSNQE